MLVGRTLGVAVVVVGCLAGTVRAQGASSTLPLDGPEAKSVTAFFDTLGEAFSAGEGSKALRCFDFDRLTDVIAAAGTDAHAKLVKNAGFRMGFEMALGRQFAAGDGRWAWARCALRRLESRDGGVLVAYVRQWDAEGVAELKRWWLAKHADSWRVFDVESVEMGMRLSQESAAALPVATGGDRSKLMALQALQRAVQEMLAGDVDAAREGLDVIPADALTPGFEAVRQLLLGAFAVGEEDAETALEHIAAARAANPDLPMTHYLEGEARVQLEQWAEADAAAVRYMDAVGPDPDGLCVRGKAARGLEQLQAAAEHFRAGLDDDPSSGDCLIGLSSVLPDDAKAEVGERFKKFPNPAAQFENVASQLLWDEDGRGLQVLAEAYRTLAPEDTNCDYYGAEALLLLEQPAAAAAMIERSMDKAPEEEREYYWDTYLNAMVQAGEAVKGYLRIPDNAYAFWWVADELCIEEDWATLKQLCATHRTRNDGDPQLHFYEAEVARSEGDLERAEKLYLRAFKLLGDEIDLTPLVELRVGLGRWKDAYDGPASHAEMFELVAQALQDAQKGADLIKLCELHAAEAPTDVSVVLWRAEGHALVNDHAAAVKALEPHRSRLQVDASYVGWFEERWVRSCCKAKRFEDALAVAQASTARDGDPWYEVVVYVLQGDVAKAGTVMRKMVAQGNDPSIFWFDEDVAAALRTPAFRELRSEFPEED